MDLVTQRIAEESINRLPEELRELLVLKTKTPPFTNKEIAELWQTNETAIARKCNKAIVAVRFIYLELLKEFLK